MGLACVLLRTVTYISSNFARPHIYIIYKELQNYAVCSLDHLSPRFAFSFFPPWKFSVFINLFAILLFEIEGSLAPGQ